MRFWIALIVGKVTKLLSVLLHRVLHREGSNLPGQVALKLCPDFLARISKPARIVCVTGTNGKTTLTNLLSDLLEKAGYRVLSNRLGANINSGIATALLRGVDLFNHSRYQGEKDIAILEVDERSSKRIYPFVRPQLVAVTNLLRDSCRRNAHPHYIFDFINEHLPEDAALVLNADDLISAELRPDQPRTYYDIARQPADKAEDRNLINDMRTCPLCHSRLAYDYIRYNHIGKAHCPACGLKSRVGDVRALSYDPEAKTLLISDHGSETVYPLISDGIFNIYNEVAAITVLRQLGLEPAVIASGLEDAHIVDSRYLMEEVAEVKLVSQMAKGQIAPAVSVAFDYVSSLPGIKRMVLILEDIREGATSSENLSYIYESDFEFLAQPEIVTILLYGKRTQDMKLRLLLAGVPEHRIGVVERLEAVPQALGICKGDTVCIMQDSYSIDIGEKTRALVKAYLLEHGPEGAEEGRRDG